MKVLLNGSPEETLNKDSTKTQVHKERREKEQVLMALTRGRNRFCLLDYLCDICEAKYPFSLLVNPPQRR